MSHLVRGGRDPDRAKAQDLPVPAGRPERGAVTVEALAAAIAPGESPARVQTS